MHFMLDYCKKPSYIRFIGGNQAAKQNGVTKMKFLICKKIDRHSSESVATVDAKNKEAALMIYQSQLGAGELISYRDMETDRQSPTLYVDAQNYFQAYKAA